MQKIYIIDASGYLYRSYHAIRNMTNARGESTNSLFGFIRSILNIIKDFNPDHIVAVFDGPNNIKKRKEIYAEYKAHRDETPGDLYYQIEWAHKFCELMGIPHLSIPEVEADDTMGSVAKWAEKHDILSYMCTSDKDMAQLVNDKIFMLDTYKENKVLGTQDVKEKFGVQPHQIIDLLAMVGDASDNVPGVPGIGPKTAAAYLNDYGTLEHILQNPQVIPEKKRDLFVQLSDQILLSQKLVTVDLHVEIPLSWDFYILKQPNFEALKEFYSNMSFNSFIKELEKSVVEPLTEEQTIPTEQTSYKLIDTQSELDDLMKLLSIQKKISFSVKYAGTRPLSSQLIGVSFAIEPTEAFYVPANGNIDRNSVLASLKSLFENPQCSFCGHNVKYDCHVLLNHGIHVKSIGFDSVLASYILSAQGRQHSLEALCLEHFGKVKMSIEEILGKGKKSIPIENLPPKILSNYSCEDADYICRLQKKLHPQLEAKEKLHALLYDMEIPLSNVLLKMEREGIYLDVNHIKAISKAIIEQINRLESEIYEMAGEKFNLNSPKQLSEILFIKLGIKAPKKTATGFSTNADVLESLKSQHPIAAKMQDYRTVEKLRSTYIDTLPLEINPKTQRIHCTFNQFVAATGRLSCQDPNLQNIPVRTEAGIKIRECFRPQKEGWSYLAADYSQIELRLLAHLSQDTNLIKAFRNNEDIHVSTAAKMYNIPIETVTKEQRHNAKAVNFGVVYGQQAFGLSQELNIEVKEAAKFIETYFQRYPQVKAYLESNKEHSKQTGMTSTYIGRERHIPEIHSKNGIIRAAAERLAINTPLQGTAADLIKLAMLQIDKEITERQLQGFMILQIHDELIFELPDSEIEEMTQLVRQVMENVLAFDVPLVVDINVGKNWKEC